MTELCGTTIKGNLAVVSQNGNGKITSKLELVHIEKRTDFFAVDVKLEKVVRQPYPKPLTFGTEGSDVPSGEVDPIGQTPSCELS